MSRRKFQRASLKWTTKLERYTVALQNFRELEEAVITECKIFNKKLSKILCLDELIC